VCVEPLRAGLDVPAGLFQEQARQEGLSLGVESATMKALRAASCGRVGGRRVARWSSMEW
jgi:hypothetical protein